MMYKEFKEIKREFARVQKKYAQDNISTLNGLKESTNELLSRWWVKDRTTPTQRAKALKGIITTKELKKIVADKIKREANKKIEEFNFKCDEIAQAQDIKSITIRVDWVKSATWGMNPHAESLTSNGYFFGTASGCGYDKLSTAVASALNQDISILKRLYNAFEKALRKGVAPCEAVGYGSGYTYPYFEGGVGYGSFKNIFDNLGAKVNQWNETKTSDFMYIEF